MTERIVIVGGGQAAASCIAALRSSKAAMTITLVGEEDHLPYRRPPLSKAALVDGPSVESLLIRPKDWYEGVELKLGRRACEIARKDGRVILSDGEQLAYDKLVFCSGSRARQLSDKLGGNLEGVHTLRSIADAERLRSELVSGRRVLVVGGGYIGLEVAASARKHGLSVLLVEAGERILGRVASSATAQYLRSIHESRGVEIRETTGVQLLAGDKRATHAILTDGSEHAVDIVVVGIGGLANDEIASSAGLETSNGIVVDAYCKTADPNIFAAGDCATFPFGDRSIRLESVQNATDQGEVVAASLTGREKAYAPVPWFWSDQYETKLQIVGIAHGHDDIIVRPGQRDNARSIWYFRQNELIAVDAINDPASYMAGRRLLTAKINPDRANIADPNFPLATMLAAAR